MTLRCFALVGLCFAVSPALHAQEQNFNIERLHLAVDRDGILDVEWANIEANPLEYDVALALGYELNPLVVSERFAESAPARVGQIVGHKFTGTFIAALTITKWLEVGGELPLVLFQTPGDLPSGFNPGAISAIGLADARLLAKIQVLREKDAFVDLSVIPALTVPTAFPQESYTGEAFPTLVPQLAAAKRLWAFRVAGTLGARFRPTRDTFGINVHHELNWQAAAGWRVIDPVEIQASVLSSTSFVRPYQDANTDPVEVLGGASWDAIRDKLQVFGGVGVGVVAGFGTPDFRAFVGVRWAPRAHDLDGDGILDDIDVCPEVPEDKDGFEDRDGCPDPDNDGDGIYDDADRCPNVNGQVELGGCLAGDLDGDGIRDEEDKCPTEPEDADGFEDEDGCPDLDNDGDGIIDVEDKCPFEAEDKDDFEDIDGCPEDDNDGDGLKDDVDQCPNEPEDMDGDKDEDGCPDNAKIIVTKKKVFTLEKIYFDFGKATIKQQSFDLLDGVAAILKENPDLGKVRVEGHTDSVGSEGFNLWLSQQRTDSVRAALIERGVPADQLVSQGFGESKPISTNDTPDGREKNRRVEFVFVEAATPPAGIP